MKLYLKSRQDSFVLKDLLQFIRSTAPGKRFSFSYIEASTSLLPNLSLWENLQLVSGFKEWPDLISNLNPEYQFLTNLLTSPEILASKAEDWDRMMASLIIGIISNPEFLLIDINETNFSTFNLQNFKKIVTLLAPSKTILLATANASLWTEVSKTLITKEGYEFKIQDLSVIKKNVA